MMKSVSSSFHRWCDKRRIALELCGNDRMEAEKEMTKLLYTESKASEPRVEVPLALETYTGYTSPRILEASSIVELISGQSRCRVAMWRTPLQGTRGRVRGGSIRSHKVEPQVAIAQDVETLEATDSDRLPDTLDCNNGLTVYQCLDAYATRL